MPPVYRYLFIYMYKQRIFYKGLSHTGFELKLNFSKKSPIIVNFNGIILRVDRLPTRFETIFLYISNINLTWNTIYKNFYRKQSGLRDIDPKPGRAQKSIAKKSSTSHRKWCMQGRVKVRVVKSITVFFY